MNTPNPARQGRKPRTVKMTLGKLSKLNSETLLRPLAVAKEIVLIDRRTRQPKNREQMMAELQALPDGAGIDSVKTYVEIGEKFTMGDLVQGNKLNPLLNPLEEVEIGVTELVKTATENFKVTLTAWLDALQAPEVPETPTEKS